MGFLISKDPKLFLEDPSAQTTAKESAAMQMNRGENEESELGTEGG